MRARAAASVHAENKTKSQSALCRHVVARALPCHSIAVTYAAAAMREAYGACARYYCLLENASTLHTLNIIYINGL